MNHLMIMFQVLSFIRNVAILTVWWLELKNTIKKFQVTVTVVHVSKSIQHFEMITKILLSSLVSLKLFIFCVVMRKDRIILWSWSNKIKLLLVSRMRDEQTREIISNAGGYQRNLTSNGAEEERMDSVIINSNATLKESFSFQKKLSSSCVTSCTFYIS